MKNIFCCLLVCFLLISSCEDQIVSECNVTKDQTTIAATFTSIQNNVFTPDCATAGCHVANSVEPVLTAGVAYNNIVNVMSFNPPFPYVYPSRSDSSYLINKLKGINITGERMPLNRNALSAATIDSIAAWINKGAPNN